MKHLYLCLYLISGPVAAETLFAPVDPDLAKLGQLLFYDPILSGSREVSCATCHHPKHGTGDGVSLGLGDGARGLGPERRVDPENTPEQRIPRNAPALFNLGADGFSTMFHDGRLQADASRASGIRTPLGADMEAGFASVLSAQSMFPVLSGDEMAGHYSENEISQAVRQGLLTGEGGAWARLSMRVEAIPHYRALFDGAFGQGTPIHFTDISDALAAFMAFEWRSDTSPYDRFLAGEPLPDLADQGRLLFEGKAGCSTCHAGDFQTDHDFHAIAMPQIGPGKAARFEAHARDEGRFRVTGQLGDLYAFRTPSLRNVALTAPYGHAGAFATLEGVVRHHLDPLSSLFGYDRTQAILPPLEAAQDFRVLDDAAEMARIAKANVLEPILLEDAEVAALVAFLHALTDPAAIEGRLGVPARVPSGLPVDQ